MTHEKATLKLIKLIKKINNKGYDINLSCIGKDGPYYIPIKPEYILIFEHFVPPTKEELEKLYVDNK